MRELDDDLLPELPFPLSDVSNGEWSPRPPSAKQRAAARLILEEADRRARRLGMSRREFLRTAAGTATAFMVLNTVNGLPSSGRAASLPITQEQCDDPQAARELFSEEFFVMDVQLHHVDLEQFGDIPGLGFLRFYPPEDAGNLELLSQANMVKEVWVDSETEVGVISGVPNGVPLPVETMKATRDLTNELAGSERALIQAMIDPKRPPGSETSIDSMEHQVVDNGARAIKSYTGSGNWWLDDEEIAYPMYEAATRLGLGLINVHKGFPGLLGPGAPEFVRSRDFPKALADWPQLRFVAYHSGYFPGAGIGEFLDVVRSLDRALRRRLYAEIGSSFAVAFLQSPEAAAHLVGSLMKELGPSNILWGTDSIWWGSPQWQIEAFKALEIPAAMRKQFGYPPLTRGRKAKILGKNAARLYKLHTNEKRCEIQADQIAQIKRELGGPEKSRTHLVYGPQDEEGFHRLLAHGAGRNLESLA